MQPSGQGSYYETYHRPDTIAATWRCSWVDLGKMGWAPNRVGRGGGPRFLTSVHFGPGGSRINPDLYQNLSKHHNNFVGYEINRKKSGENLFCELAVTVEERPILLP